jgi:hypothetical protein
MLIRPAAMSFLYASRTTSTSTFRGIGLLPELCTQLSRSAALIGCIASHTPWTDLNKARLNQELVAWSQLGRTATNGPQKTDRDGMWAAVELNHAMCFVHRTSQKFFFFTLLFLSACSATV